MSSDEVKVKLQSAINNLHEKIAARIEHDPEGYLKAIAALEKSVQKLPSSYDSALQKSLFIFGKSVTEVSNMFNNNWGVGV